MKPFTAFASLISIGLAYDFLQQANLNTPTVIFHGFTDHCKNRWIGDKLADHIAKVSGAHAECVEIDAPFDDPTQASYKSIFNNFNHYSQAACKAVADNANFAGKEFNLIGISQGSLVARYLVENCTNLKVRNLWTIGGPHRGVHSFPFCADGIWCDSLTYLIENPDSYESLQE